MFKDVSIWCVILSIVILMVIHHTLSDKPLFEGNENIDEEEPTEEEPTEEVVGDSAVEAEKKEQEDDYMDLSRPESVNLTIKTDTAAELQAILLQKPIESEETTEVEETENVDEPLPAEEETESLQEPFM